MSCCGGTILSGADGMSLSRPVGNALMIVLAPVAGVTAASKIVRGIPTSTYEKVSLAGTIGILYLLLGRRR